MKLKRTGKTTAYFTSGEVYKARRMKTGYYVVRTNTGAYWIVDVDNDGFEVVE